MIEQTYHNLMNQLGTIHHRIADARRMYDDTRKASADAERIANDEKGEIVIALGGYSALGKNAEEREYNLQAKLNASTRYTAALAFMRKAAAHEADAKRNLEDLKTEFESLQIQARLTGDFLKYSALAAAKPEAASLLDL